MKTSSRQQVSKCWIHAWLRAYPMDTQDLRNSHEFPSWSDVHLLIVTPTPPGHTHTSIRASLTQWCSLQAGSFIITGVVQQRTELRRTLDISSFQRSCTRISRGSRPLLRLTPRVCMCCAQHLFCTMSTPGFFMHTWNT